MKRADLLASLNIGASIKKLREEKGLSQEELAKDICDRTNITKLENGHSKIPSFSFVMLLCERLDVTIEEFLNYSLMNNYSLDKKLILDYLLANDLLKMKEYILSIDINSLTTKDQNLYQYLSSKVLIFEDKTLEAKEKLLFIKNDTTDLINILIIHELIKNNFINKDYGIYKKENIEQMINKNTPLLYLYFINDLLNISLMDNNLEKAKYYLEKEIQFLNIKDGYRYLPIYYQNKINIYKDDYLLVNDIKNKLLAIQVQKKE